MSAPDAAMIRLAQRGGAIGVLAGAHLTQGCVVADAQADGLLDAVRDFLIAHHGRRRAYEIMTRAAEAALDGATLRQGDAVTFQKET